MRNILSRGLMASCLIAFAHMSLAAEPVQSGKAFDFMQEEIKKVKAATNDSSVAIRICEQKQPGFDESDWSCEHSFIELGTVALTPNMYLGRISSTSQLNYVVSVGKRPDAEGYVAEHNVIKLHSTFELYTDDAGLPRFEYSYLGIDDIKQGDSMDPETPIDLLNLSERRLDAAIPGKGEVFSSVNQGSDGNLYYVIVSRGSEVELPAKKV
ncbi:hypothetical protein CMK12_17785 [Candidatus Poribacteria bacterium]|nr:hypothetical protein [Candidatus Poribacteria bacterium]